MATFDPAFLDQIEALPVQEWQGRAWRHMFNDNAPERINTMGARWNPRGVGAIYSALDREAAIAEGQHAIDVQPRRIFRRRVLYELSIEVGDLVDLTAPEALATAGLTMLDVASDDHGACQHVGGAFSWLGRGGLLVPSARHPGDNLVILLGPGGGAEIERVSQIVLFDEGNDRGVET